MSFASTESAISRNDWKSIILVYADAPATIIFGLLSSLLWIHNPSTFIDKLKLLQDKDVQFNTTQAEGNTLLHLAAKANDLELLKRIAAFDIDIDAKNDEGLTALHVAAMKAADDKMMKYLISKGADTKVKTDFEETVYDLAIENEMLQKQNTSLNFLK